MRTAAVALVVMLLAGSPSSGASQDPGGEGRRSSVLEIDPEVYDADALIAAGVQPLPLSRDSIRFSGGLPQTLLPRIVVEFRAGRGDMAEMTVTVLEPLIPCDGEEREEGRPRCNVSVAGYEAAAADETPGRPLRAREPVVYLIPMSDYRALARLVDAQFERSGPDTTAYGYNAETGVTTVGEFCLDGASYLTERVMDGEGDRLDGESCRDDDANSIIARRVFKLLPPDLQRRFHYLDSLDRV